jgi:S1-C subfamily serine protease
MRRTALYSRARRKRSAPVAGWTGVAVDPTPPHETFDELAGGPSDIARASNWLKRHASRHERALLLLAAVLFAFAGVGGWSLLHPPARVLKQDDIDAAVQYTLTHSPRAPADSARAAAAVRAAVVEVQAFLSPEHAAALAQKAAHSAPKDNLHQHPKAPDAAPPSDKPMEPGTPDEPQPDAIGSGVVITESGRILTALHVVSGTDRWVVIFADG